MLSLGCTCFCRKLHPFNQAAATSLLAPSFSEAGQLSQVKSLQMKVLAKDRSGVRPYKNQFLGLMGLMSTITLAVIAGSSGTVKAFGSMAARS